MARSNIYERKYLWKIGLIVTALIIVIASVIYTNVLARSLQEQERQRLQLWADAYNEINKTPFNVGDCEFNFLSMIIRNNDYIPVILTDETGKVTGSRNLADDRTPETDPQYFNKQLANMKGAYDPIVMVTPISQIATSPRAAGAPEEIKQLIYYNDSYTLRQLRIYPYVQFFIIGIFLLMSYLAFNTARRAEQNKVWLGMAKETAHQLGTPLSSMVGWVELLKDTEDPDGIAKMAGTEMDKDVSRLQLIAERFSKIGSIPKLVESDMVTSVRNTVNYMKHRASSKVAFEFNSPESIKAKTNPTLFDWVIENLLKNALDAMGNKGKIIVTMSQENDKVIIDVSDTGKGIPKGKFSTVFQPGYSTKQRGWGLGLSLSKRIVELNHKGKIYVKESSKNGTTFRVMIPQALAV